MSLGCHFMPLHKFSHIGKPNVVLSWWLALEWPRSISPKLVPQSCPFLPRKDNTGSVPIAGAGSQVRIAFARPQPFLLCHSPIQRAAFFPSIFSPMWDWTFYPTSSYLKPSNPCFYFLAILIVYYLVTYIWVLFSPFQHSRMQLFHILVFLYQVTISIARSVLWMYICISFVSGESAILQFS